MNGGNVAVALVSGARGTKMGGNRFYPDTLNDRRPWFASPGDFS